MSHYPGILVRDGRTCGEDELPPVGRPKPMPIPPKKPKAEKEK